MKNIKKFFIAILPIFVFMLVGCAGKEINKEPNEKESVNNQNISIDEESAEKVVDVEIDKDSIKARNEFQQGVVYIDAIVKNNSTKILNQVIISVNFVDKDNNVLNTVDYTIDINLNSNSQDMISVQIPSGEMFYDFNLQLKNYTLK